MIITIDGPTASGKSSVARALADKLNVYYLNTGLLYRALGYIACTAYNYTLATLPTVSDQTIQAILPHLLYRYATDGAQILYKNSDITENLKNPSMDQAASIISAVPIVRMLLLDYQRNFARHHSLVVDGRDCGSVVFPYAELKIFLTASVQVRAERWRNDLARKGQYFTEQDSIAFITERDKRDEERAIAPLIVPQGAIVIDNSTMSLQQTVEQIVALIQL